MASPPSAVGDLIYTAIERHKAVWRADEAMLPTVDVVAAERRGRQVSLTDWDAYERARALEDETFDKLATTAVPKTAAGTPAIIAHLIRLDDERSSQKMRQLHALLQKSPVLAD